MFGTGEYFSFTDVGIEDAGIGDNFLGIFSVASAAKCVVSLIVIGYV